MTVQNIDKQAILDAAKAWFRETIAANHAKNTAKLAKQKAFNINPFLVTYLAQFLTGNSSPTSIAKALVYPRALGTSINTSFGQNSQKFTSEVLKSFGSVTPGIDIEFIDQLDGNKKYCQLKAGPNTINKDDVRTVHNHFTDIKNLAKTNNLRIGLHDLVVGVLYGEPRELSGNYKSLTNQYHYPVYVGKEFWHRLTGDEDFYFLLAQALASIAAEFDGTKLLEKTINDLADTEMVKKLSS